MGFKNPVNNNQWVQVVNTKNTKVNVINQF